MSAIRVTKTIHIEQPSILEEAHLRSVSYIAHDKDSLFEHVRIGGQRDHYFKTNHMKDSGYQEPPGVIRQSDDNGETWHAVGAWQRRRPLRDGIELDIHELNWVLHPNTGGLLRMYRTNEDAIGLLPWDEGSPVNTTRRLWWEMSLDRGNTWSKPQQVIMSGDRYDEVNWAPGVSYGKNGAVFEAFTPVWLDDGHFVVPYSYQPDDEPVLHRWASGALIGAWAGDQVHPSWQCGECVMVQREFSSGGSTEPSITLLPDGRLFMSIRVRTGPNEGTTIPSGKFYAVSSDRGRTWSEQQLLCYEDGSQVYSPACLGHVFCSAKNQKLYLITNIIDKPSHGCDPRTTLQIAEINKDSFGVIKDSIAIIDTVSPDQSSTIRFSNFVHYEDRQTGDLVLFMTGCPGNVGRSETCGVPPHAYRYDIILPEN